MAAACAAVCPLGKNIAVAACPGGKNIANIYHQILANIDGPLLLVGENIAKIYQ